jgi:HK97 gp10 family phage protein
MDLSFKIDGLDKLATASERVKKNVADELDKALLASAKRIELTAKKKILQGKKTGRIYKVRTVMRRTSAPGEAPANQTGKLANSINSYVNRISALVFEGFTIAGRGMAKYAPHLEFGTKKMAARPFMFPSAEECRAWIKARLTRAVDDGIKRSAKK